eukprot:TRINITY_DN61806_c0_g1_i1.p1 TRINITY_DN61806_c0_g1~~TRINITY_DN61806_c0_g1_i1.p1  ORF type:complete len:174 (-),score=23.93 TRINITY_DN61806_c0_g1_i1:73-567(-)
MNYVIRVGSLVKIRRSSGCIQDAYVLQLPESNDFVTVWWFENGIEKVKKEVDMTEIFQLNSSLFKLTEKEVLQILGSNRRLKETNGLFQEYLSDSEATIEKLKKTICDLEAKIQTYQKRNQDLNRLKEMVASIETDKEDDLEDRKEILAGISDQSPQMLNIKRN